MILTGTRIRDELAAKRINIRPYDPARVGPNSVDLCIANELRVYAPVIGDELLDPANLPSFPIPSHYYGAAKKPFADWALDAAVDNPTSTLSFPTEGRVLRPGILYLARTVETIHSDYYVPIVEGRSSFGRLGLHVHVTAGFCDVGFRGTITLEMHVVHPLRIYPNVPICQVYFLRPEGVIELYKGKYQGQHDTTPSRMFQEPPKKE